MRIGRNLRPSEINNIREKLRALARLLIVLRSKTTPMATFEQLLHPRNYDCFRDAVRELAEQSHQLALTLGHYIKRINLLNIGEAIKQQDMCRKRNGDDFQSLFNSNWSTTVAAATNKEQRLKKLNKKAKLPLASDLAKLTTHIKGTIPKLVDTKDLALLQKYILAGLILFNKRRPMEVAELQINDFQTAIETAQDLESGDCLDGLTKTERLIAKGWAAST